MARIAYIVFSLAGIVLPHCFTSAKTLPSLPSSTEDQPPTPIPSGLPGLTHRTLEVEEMEASLAINQLAILHILNEDSSGSERERTSELEGMSEVLEELRRLKEDLVVLRESQATFQWRQSELREGLTEVKESQAEMRGEVKIFEGSIREVKGNHDLLNDTLTTLNDSLSTLKSHASVHSDSLSTLKSHVNVHNDSLSTLKSNVETMHNKSIIHNITVGTMMEGMQTLNDDVRFLQFGNNQLQEDHDAHQEDFFIHAGTIFHHEGRMFFMNTVSNLTWSVARQWCQARGGDLAQPTRNFATFLLEVMKRAPLGQSSKDLGVWLGASDEEQEGQWVWLSGSSIPSDFPWGDGQPNNYGNQDCLEIVYKLNIEKYYNDRKCSSLKYAVCEI